jgi:hypothetical protein
MSKVNITKPEPQTARLQEGRDYYLEKGYFVFTAYYLQLQGKCCGSGCRHCPYRKKKDAPTVGQ